MPKRNKSARTRSSVFVRRFVFFSVELTLAQIVLLGNKSGDGGRYRIGHSVMRDALDIDGI